MARASHISGPHFAAVQLATLTVGYSSSSHEEQLRLSINQFLQRDATSHGPVSVRLSQVGVLSKRLNESSWFLAYQLPSTRPIHCVQRKFGYLQK